MSSDIITMPALGRPFTLGMLYDARQEKLIPGFSLFGDETLQKYASEKPQPSSRFDVDASDSTESKSSQMNIEASLGVSFLGGLVEVGGSGRYLNNMKKYQNQGRVTLNYKTTTSYKEFKAPPGTVVQPTVITDNGVATHVVTSILYGANAFFVFDSVKQEDSKLQDIQGRMEAVIKKIPFVSIEGHGAVKLTDEEKSLTSNLSCKFHGDFILESLPTTFEEAVTAYQQLPQLLGEKGVNAVPMEVCLVPLSKFDSKAQQLVTEISRGSVRKIHSVLEEVRELKRRCNDAEDDTIVTQFPLIHDRVSNFQQILQDYSLTLQQTIAKKLPLIRGGKEDVRILENIIADRAKSPFSNENVSLWLDIIGREIGAIKACVGMMTGTQTKFVANQTELDREVLDANVTHALCFIFTSLECRDGYLRVLSDFLDSPTSERTEDFALSTDGMWCYSNWVVLKMKQRAATFCDLAKSMNGSRNVRFLVAAIRNEKYQGASIYYYRKGSLVTQDFTFPRMPPVESFKDRTDLLWYACDLTFDPNTANKSLTLSDDNKNAESGKKQTYLDHPERFTSFQQVLCREGLDKRHYWEVEWTGTVRAGVSYIAIGRKDATPNSCVGESSSSWAINHVPKIGYTAMNQKSKEITVSSPRFKRLGMYLDWRAGILSYYMVSSERLHHIHTFRTTFTDLVYPAFRVGHDSDHGKLRLL